MFIVIEGADGFGKSTLVNRLVKAMNETMGHTVHYEFPRRETPVGKLIDLNLRGERPLPPDPNDLYSPSAIIQDKENALVFQCLHIADKYAASGEIAQHLRAGTNVVCGRWWQSAYVYGVDDSLDERWLRTVHENLVKPDLNVLLELSEEEM